MQHSPPGSWAIFGARAQQDATNLPRDGANPLPPEDFLAGATARSKQQTISGRKERLPARPRAIPFIDRFGVNRLRRSIQATHDFDLFSNVLGEVLVSIDEVVGHFGLIVQDPLILKVPVIGIAGDLTDKGLVSSVRLAGNARRASV